MAAKVRGFLKLGADVAVFPLMLMPTQVYFFFIPICGQFSFLSSTSRLFLLIFSRSEIQGVIFVSVPVWILRLLDHFGDVRAVRRGVVDVNSLCWLILQQK